MHLAHLFPWSVNSINQLIKRLKIAQERSFKQKSLQIFLLHIRTPRSVHSIWTLILVFGIQKRKQSVFFVGYFF